MTTQIPFQKPLVIIPAAGFGRRVGSPNSKEMLLFEGKPLIEFVIGECETRNWPMHLLTRPEKTELLSYLERRKVGNFEIQLVEETKEWPETVLHSRPFWHEWNLLLLPDMIFKPSQVLDLIFQKMQSADYGLIAAGREVNEPQVWGCLKTSTSGFEICEKPRQLMPAWAWGILGYRKSLGAPLFQALLESGADHQWKKFEDLACQLNLEQLEDLTR
jgi:dTDP-glucose pyrophosphorylase